MVQSTWQGGSGKTAHLNHGQAEALELAPAALVHDNHAPPRHAPRLLARAGVRPRAASPPAIHVGMCTCMCTCLLHAHVHVHVHVAGACVMASAVSGVAWASERSTCE